MYVDALFDRERDIIHVAERVNGRREYREYPARYIFYYKDNRGKFSIIVLFVLNWDINFSLIFVFSFEFIKSLQLKHLDLIVSSKNLFSRCDIKK